MAIRHGNKTYLQILLDPHRAKLLMDVAESLQVRPTSWIRDVSIGSWSLASQVMLMRKLLKPIKKLGATQSSVALMAG